MIKEDLILKKYGKNLLIKQHIINVGYQLIFRFENDYGIVLTDYNEDYIGEIEIVKFEDDIKYNKIGDTIIDIEYIPRYISDNVILRLFKEMKEL